MVNVRFVFVYTGIRVRDLDRSIEFYTRVLGMRLLRREKVDENKGEFAMLGCDGSDHGLELNWYSDESPIARPYPEDEGEELDHLAFEVENLEASLTFLKAQGYPPVMGPVVDDRFAVAYVKDPDSIWVEFYQRLDGDNR